MIDDNPTPARHFLQVEGVDQCRSFVFSNLGEPDLLALVVGELSTASIPLVRLHSRCVYGEVLGSLDCDCKAQIKLAFQRLKQEGAGLFLYLEHEGRGCGLFNKARAYELKETEGLDTVEAYRQLGLTVDARTYEAAVRALRYFGFERVRLLTNNPAKVAGLTKEGIGVEQVPLRAQPTSFNREYLLIKQSKLGHDLGLDPGAAVLKGPNPANEETKE